MKGFVLSHGRYGAAHAEADMDGHGGVCGPEFSPAVELKVASVRVQRAESLLPLCHSKFGGTGKFVLYSTVHTVQGTYLPTYLPTYKWVPSAIRPTECRLSGYRKRPLIG
jgi:hypothetical protein